ncbi:MAG: DUF3617 domain-containing protein [Gammaproteobacteria bacterium]|nr:DUF3617 domain-containing protein [Gammaproteobacteria bacterium]MBU1645701.1 DUF3617 domain-containing protein [Gammaproteobacteria bacterium]MBU1970806.1 DUF3617 domain-containing protein [Gammaproteobacteria bacterium]
MTVRTAILATLAAASGLAQAAPVMQPGMWEITTRMEMPGMPAGMGQHVTQICYRASDVQDVSRTVPKDKNCEVKDYKLSGNTASWRMECRGETAMSGSGTFTYAGNSYSGTTKFTMKQGGQTMNMTQTYSARRVGDCK